MSRPLDLPLPATPPRWTAALAQRFWRHFALKVLGISGFMWVFFTAYFHLLRHPAYPVSVMPLTGLDRIVPFQPEMLSAYLSLWFYIGIAPGLMLTLRELLAYGAWATGLCLIGLGCFYFWPTAVPPLTIDVSQYAGFVLLQGVDAAGNACPSMHVATAVFSAVWIDHILRRVRAVQWLRWLNALWCLAIIYSTLAIRQHVALDAYAGSALGLGYAALSLRGWTRSGPGRRKNRS